jgi:hypothetical protein
MLRTTATGTSATPLVPGPVAKGATFPFPFVGTLCRRWLLRVDEETIICDGRETATAANVPANATLASVESVACLRALLT